MKNILCLVDSSAQMNQHVQFVAGLAKDVDARVHLISVAHHSKHMLATAPNHDVHEHLDEWHDYLSAIRHVSSEIEPFDISDDTFNKLSLMENEYDLFTLSLARSSAGKLLAAGLPIDKVLHEINHPVSLIPVTITRWEVKRLIYAFDPKEDSTQSLTRLSKLAAWFNANIKIFILQTGDLSEVEQMKREYVYSKFMEARLERNRVEFEVTAYPSKFAFDRSYTCEKGDLPVLTAHHTGLLKRLFGRDELVDILDLDSSPFLVLH